jgi:prolyl 4-hydroxylase
MREDSPTGSIPVTAERLFPTPCPHTGHPFVRLYENAVPLELCRELIARYDQNPSIRRAGLTGIGYVPEIKRCNEIPFSLHWSDLNDLFFEALKIAVGRYADDVYTFARIRNSPSPIIDSSYILQVYEPTGKTTVKDGGEGYDWHCDALAPETAGRILSVLAYLNDVEEGGHTDFEAWPISVKPRAGAVLFFPPFFDYAHCGRPPISSRKAIVTSFIVWPRLPYA